MAGGHFTLKNLAFSVDLAFFVKTRYLQSKMKKLYAIILLLPLFNYSQILNIERFKIEKDTARHFKFKATAGIDIYNRSASAESPVNLFGYNVDVNAMYYPKKHAYIALGKLDYLRINEDDFLNFGFLHGRVNFYRENNINYEVFAQYSFDNFRGLEPRIIAGGGVRKNLIKNNNISLVLGVGALYENERWVHPVEGNAINVNFVKSSNYLSFRYTLNEFLDLNTINYYQVGYDRSISNFRHRISSITTLNTKISSTFSLTNSFEMNYEDKPIVPITRFIFSFRTGISLDL